MGPLVGGRQPPPEGRQFHVPRPIALLAGGQGVPGGAAQAPQYVSGLLDPVRPVRERQAPRFQLRAHGRHESQRLRQLLVPGQQSQHLPHFVVMGRVQEEEGEHLGMGEAIPLGGGGEEGGALAVEEGGGVRAHGPQGAQAHGARVLQLLHQPGHVHPLLQRDEFRGRGAREEGGQQRLGVAGGQVGPARGYGHPSAGERGHRGALRSLLGETAGASRRLPRSIGRLPRPGAGAQRGGARVRAEAARQTPARGARGAAAEEHERGQGQEDPTEVPPVSTEREMGGHAVPPQRIARAGNRGSRIKRRDRHPRQSNGLGTRKEMQGVG